MSLPSEPARPRITGRPSPANSPGVRARLGRDAHLELTAAQAQHLSATMDEALEQYATSLIEPCRRIVHSAGRRLRPALTIASAAIGGDARDPNVAMPLAAAVELLHCATLVHDDVIDDASTRRGVATINAREGMPTAIVAGDALIAAAMGLAARVCGTAAAVIAETLALLCSGQAAEDALRFDVTATGQQVRQVAAGKSGSLLRAACLLGASAGGLDGALAEALGRYGTAFGVCLQTVDDILDVASTPAQLGKPVGADINAGVMTGPIVDCLRSRPELGRLLGSAAGSVEHARALRLLRTSGALENAVDSARTRARFAGAELASAGGEHGRILDLAGWVSRYVDSQLHDKIDPELAYLVPGSDQCSRRTA